MSSTIAPKLSPEVLLELIRRLYPDCSICHEITPLPDGIFARLTMTDDHRIIVRTK